jgi:hypothetical protein
MTRDLGHPFSATHDTTGRLVCNIGVCTSEKALRMAQDGSKRHLRERTLVIGK